MTHTLSFTAAFSNIILLLETCTSPLYVLRYTIPDFDCCRPKFSKHTCSVELPGGGRTYYE